jgi:enoyl-CoA hydratase/carnithine racemase
LTQAAAKEFANGRTNRDGYWAEQMRGSGDTAEGVTAFLERRAPHFTWTASGAASSPTSG